jgi:hypothetical protein
MKKFTLTLLALLPYFMCQAQDILTKRNGDEIQVKVQEVNLDEIKYKRYDNQEGPMISIAKRDVFMIKYENGTKEMYNQATPATVQQPINNRKGGYDQVSLKLSGPRIGFTVLSQRYSDNIKEEYGTELNNFMTQFGWQFETRVFTLEDGTSGLFEFVPLVGGLDQGKFLPSLSALVGIRGPKGLEFGVGPNVSLTGAGLVLAAGTNFRTQGVNFPVNFALAPSKDGARFSVLFGFNSHK